MKVYKTFQNKIDSHFWDEYETTPDPIHAKQMDEDFSLDGCKYKAGDYLGIAGMTLSEGVALYDLFAMPRSMFESMYRRRQKN